MQTRKILKAGFKVVSVSFERVQGVHIARHACGCIEITPAEYEIMKVQILEVGFYEVQPVYWDDRSLVALLNDALGPDFTL
ncbi:hypothetical protein pEaSNUABM55_00199 [Erwinia phage pEa_SNUABM_55]|nr:hypothetical protein pEaSNUABM55_00199 [Erwinia phage pEa_SNUABM_55]